MALCQALRLDGDGCEIPPQHVTPTSAELAASARPARDMHFMPPSRFPEAMPVGHPAGRTARDLGFVYGPIYGYDPPPNLGARWFHKCMDARGEEMKQRTRADVLEAALLEMIGDLMLMRSIMNSDVARAKTSVANLDFDVNE